MGGVKLELPLPPGEGGVRGHLSQSSSSSSSLPNRGLGGGLEGFSCSELANRGLGGGLEGFSCSELADCKERREVYSEIGLTVYSERRVKN